MNGNGIDIVDRLRIIWTSDSKARTDERAEAANEIVRLRNELTECNNDFFRLADAQEETILTLKRQIDRLRTRKGMK